VELIPLLKKQKIFEQLSEEELGLIANIARLEHFYKGEMIFEDTSPGKDLYIILSGEAQIYLEAITPNETLILETIAPGEILGEFAVVDSGPRSATAVCSMETTALVINGKDMMALFEIHHRMGFLVIRNMARIICGRIRKTNLRLVASLRRNF
jgi:CRP-like cAMP-binding protein